MPPTIHKARNYTGQKLKGEWLVTRKIDGVRAIKTKDGWVSRNGKPLYNIPDVEASDVEVFLGNWSDTVSAVRTQEARHIANWQVYSLDSIDSRLIICTLSNPTEQQVRAIAALEIENGHEGIVLRQGNKWYKIKDTDTFDVRVTGEVLGTGKYVGMLGALETTMGNVGTGFTDEQRRTMLGTMIGKLIEVECMELTPDRKFRHPRFVRIREDKDESDS